MKDISADHSANDKATEKVCVRELGASSHEYRGSACLSNTIWITGTLSSQALFGMQRYVCMARANSRFCVVLCLEDIDVPLHQHSLSAAINKVKFNWLLVSTSSIQLPPAQIHTSSQAAFSRTQMECFT